MSSIAPEQVVPVIDIGPFKTGTADDKARIGRAVDEACRTIGFLIVSGHGVADEVIADVVRNYRAFVALPHWEKARLRTPTDRYRGCLPMGSEDVGYSMGDDKRPPDFRECFIAGPFDHAHDEYHHGPAGARFFAPNIWPDRPAGLRAAAEAYYSVMERLAADLMDIFAVALGLPEDFFRDKIDEHITNFGMIHYPPQIEPPQANQLRCGPHSDYGSLSIVHTDSDVGGLQVLTRDDRWVDVPCIPGTFVINLGDLMAEWTNDRWRSTMHRVANPPRDRAGASKMSLLFFHQPNYDAVIECLPTCMSADNPPKYAPVTSGAHVKMKVEMSLDPHLEQARAAR